MVPHTVLDIRKAKSIAMAIVAVIAPEVNAFRIKRLSMLWVSENVVFLVYRASTTIRAADMTAGVSVMLSEG